MGLSSDPAMGHAEVATRALVERVLQELPGAMRCAVKIVVQPTTKAWEVLVAVGFSTGLESRFVHSLPLESFDDEWASAAAVKQMLTLTLRTFADKVSTYEAARWHASKREVQAAREACGEADAAFADVERTVG